MNNRPIPPQQPLNQVLVLNTHGLPEDMVEILRQTPQNETPLGLLRHEIMTILTINRVVITGQENVDVLGDYLRVLMQERVVAPPGNEIPVPAAEMGQEVNPHLPVQPQGALPIVQPNANFLAYSCKLCGLHPIEFAFIDCGDIGICFDCKMTMTVGDQTICPKCRRIHRVDRVRRVYIE